MKIKTSLISAVALLITGLVLYQVNAVFLASKKTAQLRQMYASSLSEGELLNTLPQNWLNALILIEDPNFYAHNGIDLSTPGAGLTTITQALAKFMYFEEFTPGFAKIEQSLIATLVLDQSFSKDEQLLLFLNHAYLGHHNGKEVRGFKQAAQAYFSTSLDRLSDEQFIALVAMLIAPNGFHLVTASEKHARRLKRVQRLLRGEYHPKSLTDVFYDTH